MRTIQRLGTGVSLAMLLAGALASATPARQIQIKPKPTQAPTVRFLPLPDIKTCTNCARLDIRIFSLPGDGCLHCNDLATYLNTYAFIDPDLYINNLGTIASNPGTVKLEWYDLVNKAPGNITVAIPAVPAGDWTAVGLPVMHMIFRKDEGIKMTIDYSDANGSRHRVRTVGKCPDN